MKRSIAILMICVFMFSFCGCEKKVSDLYRTYYEIYVGGFCDSNDDGIGDLPGLIHKLDYLNDGHKDSNTSLHVNGLYLMPVMPSPTYHKYDVQDYYSIDDEYGTMEDFKQLTEECDKRDIALIIDLPINHTSFANPWFTQARKNLSFYGGESEYCNYYCFSREKKNADYYKVPGTTGWYYEAVFGAGMPDLNLDSDAVRKEILDICDFWIDKGVDGFRLDAVTSYYSDNSEKNKEFLAWLCDEVSLIKEDIYFVGEAWSNAGVIAELYSSGIDSFFNFPFSQNHGVIISALKTANGGALSKALESWQDTMFAANASAIDAVFLSNHDNVRSGWCFVGDKNMQKQAAAVYLLMPGNAYVYYGEEIGMLGGSGTADQNKRTPMIWSVEDDSEMAKSRVGVSDIKLPSSGAMEQLQEDDSLLNYYIEAIKIRNKYPEIAHGTLRSLSFQEPSICGYTVSYKHATLTVLHNIGDSDMTLAWEKGGKILSGLTTGDSKPELNQHRLILPAYCTVVIR